MKAYLYNQEKIFTEEVDCPIDPLESELQGREIYIQPAESTLIAPPPPQEDCDIVYNEEDDAWDYKEKKKEEEEEPQPYVMTELDKLNERLYKIENEFQSLDYIGIKIATCRATVEEYAEEIEKMEELAQEKNEVLRLIAIEQERITIEAQA